MRKYGPNFHKSAPLVRLLVALISGIILQFYLDLHLVFLGVIITAAAISFLCVRSLSTALRFRYRWITGLSIGMAMIAFGAILVYCRDIRHKPHWIGNELDASAIQVTLIEPLIEKTRSFKTIAVVNAVCNNKKWETANGRILLYFRRDSVAGSLHFGSTLIIRNKLQVITGTGNPGAFDYSRYCAAQQIYHQVYLQPEDYHLIPFTKKISFTALLYSVRDSVLCTLRKWIPGEKEAGVAEALLIGYRNDLDKDLVQAYSNTGVVHIIAISGLHLGMIYGLLIALFKPFKKYRWAKMIKPLAILSILWAFTLLTGAAASILRSAVMFSFIITGESLQRKTQIYNTLSASALCLLLFDPGLLWDIGFQLSYAAVLSIVIFMKPIYRCIYCSNKILNLIWELNSITLAAQVLTLPLILFYFHQFPNLFLFTNFIAVPLSGFVLYGELLLLLVCKIPLVNAFTGSTVSFLIAQMNGIIERTARLPFNTIDNITITCLQATLLYAGIILLAFWLFRKSTRFLTWSCACICLLTGLSAADIYAHKRQQLMIIYQVPRHTAIDIMEGSGYVFLGDKIVDRDASLRNFHLKPARLLHRVKMHRPVGAIVNKHLVRIANTTTIIVGPDFQVTAARSRIRADIVIMVHQPGVSMQQLNTIFNCKQYVFDGSNPLWKIRQWKKQADSLHLRHHSIPEQGAFQLIL